MAVQTQTRQTGDTRIALSVTCLRPDRSVVDLDSLTLYFEMYSSQGVVKVEKTTSNVLVTDATGGVVQYTFQDDDVDTEGTYFAYFIAESAGGAADTFPAETGDLQVIIRSEA